MNSLDDSSAPLSFPRALEGLEGDPTGHPEVVWRAFQAILAGTWTPPQIAAFLVGLRLKKESSEVILSAARALRAHMIPLPHEEARLLDTCGTGGDGSGSLNLSTGAAIIASAAGAKVAKHGNRAISSRAGSADVLQSLGIEIDLSPEAEAQVLRETGIVFLFAQKHHPALRHVGPVRKDLGVRTIFNLLGPLASPARATHQLLGVYDDALRVPLAETLGALGVQRAWVVRGENGMDEMNPFGPTRITEWNQGETSELTLRPEDFALVPCVKGATNGGDSSENARILEEVLLGAHHPSRNAFVLSAAAALVVWDRMDPREATQRATLALTSGAAHQRLLELRKASQSAHASETASSGG